MNGVIDFKLVGERLYQRRMQLHLSQKRVAKLAGISAPFYGHIEHGKRIPSVSTLYRICLALQFGLDAATAIPIPAEPLNCPCFERIVSAAESRVLGALRPPE